MKAALRIVRSAAIIAAIALPPALALAAAQFVHDADTHNWKPPVSGIAGSTEEHRVSSKRGLHKIKGSEHQDDPYRFTIYESSLNPDDSASVRAADLTSLSWSEPASSYKTVDIGSENAATAIQACISNGKIKGLRLWGRRVKSDGKLGSDVAKDEYKRANCSDKEWDTKLDCGDRKIITGVRFHVNELNDGFSGVTIRCSQIK